MAIGEITSKVKAYFLWYMVQIPWPTWNVLGLLLAVIQFFRIKYSFYIHTVICLLRISHNTELNTEIQFKIKQLLGVDSEQPRRGRRFRVDLSPSRGSSSPVGTLSRRGWNPIKLAYKLAGWPAQLATSAFNQLSQYASSPGHRAYCYAGLAVSNQDHLYMLHVHI